jgi:hypothetical protein
MSDGLKETLDTRNVGESSSDVGHVIVTAGIGAPTSGLILG